VEKKDTKNNNKTRREQSLRVLYFYNEALYLELSYGSW
jgi:hypothetical protein